MEYRENSNLTLLGRFNEIDVYHNSMYKEGEILFGILGYDDSIESGIGLLFNCEIIDGTMQISSAYPELSDSIVSVNKMNFILGGSKDPAHYMEFIAKIAKKYER